MTELEERLLAEVTKLEDGMNALSGHLQTTDRRLDALMKHLQTVKGDLTRYSEAEQQISPTASKSATRQDLILRIMTTQCLATKMDDVTILTMTLSPFLIHEPFRKIHHIRATQPAPVVADIHPG